MRSKKLLAAILALAMVVTSIQFPTVQVKAEETVVSEVAKKEFDATVLAKNAKANSEQWPAAWDNDGKAAWAFDDEGHWWHSRYEQWDQKADHEVGTEKGHGRPTTENPIWIQTGFDQEWYVSSIEYTGRDSKDGIIHNYQVLVADLDDPEAAPADTDFEVVKEGTLEFVTTAQTINLSRPVAATHIRITVTDAYDSTDGGKGDGHVAAKNISIFGYDEYPTADKAALKAAIDEAKAVDGERYTKESYQELTDALEVAEALYADEKLIQSEADEALEVLNTALSNLVELNAISSATLAENATANSQREADGLAAWAFDTEDHYWHSDAQVSAENPIWIQTGFGEKWYVTSVVYTGIGESGLISDYEISVANLAEPTATPKDSDFRVVKSGELAQTADRQTIILDKPVAATHIRITAKDAYEFNGEKYVAAKNISVTGYIMNVTAPAKDAVIPDANQYEYQKQELVAFCHFGPNTFNEIEWGEHYGNSAPDEIFTLTDNFDAETMVKTLKDAGFKKLIVTAKHHDGFCIWNSAYTTYDVESTSYATKNYDDKGGDVLWEISAACTKYDMDMGLYLSPWDIHEPSYGYKDANGNGTSKENDVLDYNDFYNNQLEEILGSPKYGNNGHFNEVWMDGAKGSGANAQDYDFQRWFTTIQKHEGKAAGYDADCMLFGAEAYTGVRWIGNEEGYSNEQTWSKSIANKTNNTIDSNRAGAHGTYAGYSNGNLWTVPEADSKITSGWFWGTTKKTPISMKDLANRYFESVGYNAVMLLNIPPNNKGQVEQAILDRVEEFGDAIRDTFIVNMAKNATITASEVRGDESEYGPANVLDGNDATYWTVNDNTHTGSLELDLGSAKTFDVVSIEESIEFGQRITSFKVEYSMNGTDWETMQEGTTIGAKRLCRTAPVKAQYVKITVSTNDTNVYTSSNSLAVAKGTVPMIAEVGIYKASEDFELAGAAPDGMLVIDERDSAFTFNGGWNNESGSQFTINQTSKWCNSGASFTVTFTGSKIYLVGTKDPAHGTANISIDGQSVGSINTHNSTRMLGEVIFESGDLTPGTHTLTLTATGVIGIDGAYVINNGGLGMVGLEEAEYVMNEDEEILVKLIRTGGSTGTATVLLSPDPGTAIQDDYDTECITEVVFAEGETVKYAPVRTRRNTNATGEQYFIVGLTTDTENLILGFNSKAKIRINDKEAFTAEDLEELIADCQALAPSEGLYTKESWSTLQAKIADAEDKIAAGNVSNVVLQSTYDALEEAKEALVIRNVATDIYNADDRFQFPNIGESKVLEMEYLEQHNNTEGDNDWPLQVTEAAWASNGKFLNCLNGNDSVILYYNAPRTGTYTAVLTYRSGDANNSLICSEADGKITQGEIPAGADDEARDTHTVTFTFQVTKQGAGVLTFKGGASKAPQIDKIEITATALNPYEYDVTKNAGENGTIEGPDTVSENGTATFTITPNEGFLIDDVRVNGTSVGAVTTYTVENVNADITIEVTYREKPFVYSVENPFTFPTEVNASATLEMEYLEQHNNTEGDNNWPLQITEATWASNGKFLNCLNGNDRVLLYYNAPKAGTYTAVVTYRSGDQNNSFICSEAEDKIVAGEVPAGAGDQAQSTHTVTFTFEVTKAGAGVLTFQGGASKAPQLDKIEITATTLKEEQIEAELKGYTLSLEGNIGVNFHMQLGEGVLADDGAYMNFTLEREDGKEYVKIPVKDATIDDETGYYVFKCTVPVKDMDTEITAQIILSDERKGSEYTYKVKNYIEDILENPGDFAESEQEVEKLSALVETMSDFGDYASAYFADEATEGTPALPTLPELTTEDLTKLENNKGVITKDEDSIYYGSSLLLKSDTILRHYFKEKVEGSTQKGNLYYIDSTGIPAHKLGEMLVTKVGDMEITYNPLSYAYIALSREGIDEELKSVMHAMYLYYEAAQEYVEANN
ncbi:MAG: discoidin domain-containing protein [Roseburia sp.]|nr:discoidin domain-containing protein [Roseburia sp.]